MTKKEFIDGFLRTFAINISAEKLKRYRIGANKKDYLWNLFASELVPCYKGDRARKEYDIADKFDAEAIQYSNGRIGYDDECTRKLQNEFISASAIDRAGLMEYYIIGADFSWCYVITHELDLCGPYFCYKP